MRTFWIGTLGALGVVIVPASGAAAQQLSEKQIAVCALTKDRSAAENFASGKLPRSAANLHDLDKVTAQGLRLLALCQEGEVRRLPTWAKLQREIRSAARKVSVTPASTALPVVKLCKHEAEMDNGVRAPFRYQIVRETNVGRSVVTDQFYAYHPSFGSAPLPRDLSVQVSEGVQIAESCHIIDSAGGLADA